MRIINIKIKDFRNIVTADVNLRKLNILTGKNSSGKTNFLLALTHALSLSKDYSERLANNVVTIHPGKDVASISTTIGEINTEVCYIFEKDSYFCLSPKDLRFEKIISKNCLSKTHKLYFSGRYYFNDGNGEVKWKSFKEHKAELYTDVSNKLVYEELFSKEVEREATKIVKISKTPLAHQEQFLDFFSAHSSVVSWVGKTDEIHAFVTERGTRETYEQVAERLKPKTKPASAMLPFEKSKFIFLLVDLQRNETQYENFLNDLEVYTGGIVKKVYISEKGPNKGEMSIDSPNGPSDIWTISRGTSILLFFILLLNWVRLPEKSYYTPSIMIFDEIDSLMHPSLMPHFKELLELISQRIQLFISTHSPYFLDGFSKDQLLLLKDTPSLSGSKKYQANRCNIYDYDSIIKRLPKDAELFHNKKNSELFVDGLIDSLFPTQEV